MIESGRPLERIFGGCLTARTDAHQILCKPPARYGHPCRIRIAFGFGFSDFSLSVPIDFREKIFVTTTTGGALDYSHDCVLLRVQPVV